EAKLGLERKRPTRDGETRRRARAADIAPPKRLSRMQGRRGASLSVLRRHYPLCAPIRCRMLDWRPRHGPRTAATELEESNRAARSRTRAPLAICASGAGMRDLGSHTAKAVSSLCRALARRIPARSALRSGAARIARRQSATKRHADRYTVWLHPPRTL